MVAFVRRFRRLFVFLIAAIASAQTPGVITVTRQYSIAVTAGGLKCTVSTTTQGATVSAYCYSGTTLVFNSSTTVFAPTPQANGAAVSYSYNGDNMTGLFWRPTNGQSVQWQIAANGTSQQGTF